jgi:hypothetical protein
VLARFKMACVLEAGYARYVAGGADNPKMARSATSCSTWRGAPASSPESSRL